MAEHWSNHFHDRDLIPWDVIWGDLLDENLNAANSFPRHGDVRFILKFLPENLGLECDLWAGLGPTKRRLLYTILYS